MQSRVDGWDGGGVVLGGVDLLELLLDLGRLGARELERLAVMRDGRVVAARGRQGVGLLDNVRDALAARRWDLRTRRGWGAGELVVLLHLVFRARLWRALGRRKVAAARSVAPTRWAQAAVHGVRLVEGARIARVALVQRRETIRAVLSVASAKG